MAPDDEDDTPLGEDALDEDEDSADEEE